jgi:hypothetical protein
MNLEDQKSMVNGFGPFITYATTKRPAYADDIERIERKYLSRISSAKDLLLFLLNMLSTDDAKASSIFTCPFTHEEELDHEYKNLYPWDCCLRFIKRFEDTLNKNISAAEYKEFLDIIIDNYELYKDVLTAYYEVYKESFCKAIEGEYEVKFISLDSLITIIKENKFELNCLEKDYEYLMDNNIPLFILASAIKETFQINQLLNYTLTLVEANILSDNRISYLYRLRLLTAWGIQDKITYLYNVKQYSQICKIFNQCSLLLSPNSIFSNSPNILLWVAYYFDSELKTAPEKRDEILVSVYEYYKRIYKILLSLKAGLQYSSSAKSTFNYDEELDKLLPSDKPKYDLSYLKKSSKIDDFNSIEKKSLDIDSIDSILKQIINMFPDFEFFSSKFMMDYFNNNIINDFNKDQEIERYKMAYRAHQNSFDELKNNNKLTEFQKNSSLNTILDDLPYKQDMESFDGISLEEIKSNKEIWESFDPTTTAAIKSSFSMMNYADIPVDLAVLNILRCIEREFIPKFIEPFNKRFYCQKRIESYNGEKNEENIHKALFRAIKYEYFMLGDMENLGEFLSEENLIIHSPLINNFYKYLGENTAEFCALCAKLKACNADGSTSKNCSNGFISTPNSISLKELRNNIAHGNKQINKIDKITFKRVYGALLRTPLEILINIVKLSKIINLDRPSN